MQITFAQIRTNWQFLLLFEIENNVIQRTVEAGMPARLFCLEVARMRRSFSVTQLARRCLTSISTLANQRSSFVDVSPACRGELQRRGGPTGMCNTASPPPFSLLLSHSLVPVLSTRLPQIFISGSTANWSRRAARFFTVRYDASKFESSTEQCESTARRTWKIF